MCFQSIRYVAWDALLLLFAEITRGHTCEALESQQILHINLEYCFYAWILPNFTLYSYVSPNWRLGELRDPWSGAAALGLHPSLLSHRLLRRLTMLD